MSPLALLFLGLILVLGGILGFRLHAFLALIVAAMVVSAWTPREAIYASNLGRSERGVLFPEVALTSPGLVPGEARLEGAPAAMVANHLTALKRSTMPFPKRVAEDFGKACGNFAILIALAGIIGKCLLDSGAAQRVVLSLQRTLGEGRAPLAFTTSGFILGIPVFFDTVFFLLMPLGKALHLRTGKNYLLYILAIVAGATMAHSLVPPTPGPLMAASDLKVDLGLMMAGGMVVGLVAVSGGYGYALWANRRWVIPLRPSADLTEKDLEAAAHVEATNLPSLWISLLPILLPVLLIGAGTLASVTQSGPAWAVTLFSPFRSGPLAWVTDNQSALLLSTGIALGLVWSRSGRSFEKVADATGTGLVGAGQIILITAAGSAFGAALKSTGLPSVLAGIEAGSAFFWIPVAYLVTALIRTAQGSATVAMTTAVSIVAPIVAGVALPYHPLYLALAIGCGSKPISWANDSGFWLIGRMSGMTEKETFRTVSVMMIVMSFCGLGAVLLGAWLLPMVG